MTIRITAYDTTVGSAYLQRIGKTKDAIREAIVKGCIGYNSYGLKQVDSFIPTMITGLDHSESTIPYFTHPLIVEFENKKINDGIFICSDMRPFANAVSTSNGAELRIRNKMEFDLARMRHILNTIWLVESPKYLRDMSGIPATIFSSWISEFIAKRFALDPGEQLKLIIITAYYYYSLFETDSQFHSDDTARIIGAVIKTTRAPANMVTEIFDKLTTLSSIKDYCSNVVALLDNPRLENFNEGILITIVCNAWFGTNASEILAVALEHPPTWIAVCYSSFVERTFKNSGIAKISERYALNKGGNDFIKSLISVTKNYTD